MSAFRLQCLSGLCYPTHTQKRKKTITYYVVVAFHILYPAIIGSSCVQSKMELYCCKLFWLSGMGSATTIKTTRRKFKSRQYKKYKREKNAKYKHRFGYIVKYAYICMGECVFVCDCVCLCIVLSSRVWRSLSL